MILIIIFSFFVLIIALVTGMMSNANLETAINHHDFNQLILRNLAEQALRYATTSLASNYTNNFNLLCVQPAMLSPQNILSKNNNWWLSNNSCNFNNSYNIITRYYYVDLQNDPCRYFSGVNIVNYPTVEYWQIVIYSSNQANNSVILQATVALPSSNNNNSCAISKLIINNYLQSFRVL